ncbi:MAG: sigma-70 family RNA polymerase sigma factor [Verrucomicrobia bacterium]|nr:sigma-70 family RNA polymerase sigma factor [Verrucomicrobiota bacterium]MBI3868226.1 sigma-70 family RNA polymerase sigma factor [Verrucomicrobiota bacterium]
MKRSGTDPMPTRASLLERLKNPDDQRSHQEFYDLYRNLIYGVAMKYGLSDADAQDIIQETMKSVSAKLGEFKYDPKVGSFKAWLLQNTRWRILELLRVQKKDPKKPTAYSDDTRRTGTMERLEDPAGNSLDEIWEAEWHRTLLDRAMAKVREQVRPLQYQIFECYVLKDWPIEKVTKTLGVSATQAYLAKLRVGKKLREEVKGLEDQLI